MADRVTWGLMYEACLRAKKTKQLFTQTTACTKTDIVNIGMKRKLKGSTSNIIFSEDLFIKRYIFSGPRTSGLMDLFTHLSPNS